MNDLCRRVDVLERRQPACALCVSWPAYRIVSPRGDTIEGAAAAACPACGRRAAGKAIVLDLAPGETL